MRTIAKADKNVDVYQTKDVDADAGHTNRTDVSRIWMQIGTLDACPVSDIPMYPPAYVFMYVCMDGWMDR